MDPFLLTSLADSGLTGRIRAYGSPRGSMVHKRLPRAQILPHNPGRNARRNTQASRHAQASRRRLGQPRKVMISRATTSTGRSLTMVACSRPAPSAVAICSAASRRSSRRPLVTSLAVPLLDDGQRDGQLHDLERQVQRGPDGVHLGGAADEIGEDVVGNAETPVVRDDGGEVLAKECDLGRPCRGRSSSGSPGRAGRTVGRAARAGRRSPQRPSSCPTRTPR